MKGTKDSELEELKNRVKILEKQMSMLLKALDKFADGPSPDLTVHEPHEEF